MAALLCPGVRRNGLPCQSHLGDLTDGHVEIRHRGRHVWLRQGGLEAVQCDRCGTLTPAPSLVVSQV